MLVKLKFETCSRQLTDLYEVQKVPVRICDLLIFSVHAAMNIATTDTFPHVLANKPSS